MELVDVQARLEQYLPGQTIGEVTRLAAGWETDVYGFTANDRPLVLRVYAGGDVLGRVALEAQVMERLGRQGYPVPAVVAWDRDPAHFGGAFLIMERVVGRPMWQYKADHPEIGQQFYTLLARLHELEGVAPDAEFANTFDLDILAPLLADAGLTAAFQPVTDLLRQWEPKVGRERRSLIHGDFHMDNILVTADGAPYVIDWSGGALDDPRVDVAQAAVLALTNGNPAGAQAIRAGYEAVIGHPLADFDFFELLALARRVISVVVTTVSGSAAMGLRPGLEAEMRKALPQVHGMVQLLEQRSGVRLDAVHAALDAKTSQA